MDVQALTAALAEEFELKETVGVLVSLEEEKLCLKWTLGLILAPLAFLALLG